MWLKGMSLLNFWLEHHYKHIKHVEHNSAHDWIAVQYINLYIAESDEYACWLLNKALETGSNIRLQIMKLFLNSVNINI
jgi:hypothetical protein